MRALSHAVRQTSACGTLASVYLERVVVLLCNPRRQRWGDHCQLVGPRIVGRTPTGRATVALLRLNDEARLIDRQMLIEARRYPPLHMQEALNMEAE